MSAADHNNSTIDAGVDLAAYVTAMQVDDETTCAVIEKRYGLYGLSPQQVVEELSELISRKDVLP